MAVKLNIGFVIYLCCFRERVLGISTCEYSAQEKGYETVHFCNDTNLASNDTIVLDGFSVRGTPGECTCKGQVTFLGINDSNDGITISDLSKTYHINPGCGASINYLTSAGNVSIECSGAINLYSKRNDAFTLILNKTQEPYNSSYCLKIKLETPGNITLSCSSPNTLVTSPWQVITTETESSSIFSEENKDKNASTTFDSKSTKQQMEATITVPFEIIIPAAFGGAVVIIVFGIIIVCCTRRKSGKRQTAETGNNFESGINTNQNSKQQHNEGAHELSSHALEHGDDYGMQYNTLYTGHNTIKKDDTNNQSNGRDVVQSESTGDVYAVPNKGRNKKFVPNIDNVEETVCDVPKHISNITPTENKETDEAPVSKNNYLYAIPNKKKLSKTEYINTSFDTEASAGYSE